MRECDLGRATEVHGFRFVARARARCFAMKIGLVVRLGFAHVFAHHIGSVRVGGGPAAHGSMFHRRIGSIGMRQTPGRSWKNQRMPGHMGSKFRTVQNLTVVKIIADKNLILVKGAIPGANGDDVIIRSGKKAKPAKKA